MRAPTPQPPARAATPEGTRRYAERQVAAGNAVAEHYREAHGLLHSTIGIGTYLGKEDDATDAGYRDAIASAIRQGANVVDLAVSYRSQRSERAAGAALSQLFASGECSRDEIVVSTKGGYIPWDGRPPADPSLAIHETYIRTGILEPDDIVDGRHAIAPRFLRDQIERSLSNTGLDAFDVYFLHNPEAQLESMPRATFQMRVRKAFELLEGEAGAGRITRYGIATWNGLRCPPDERGYLSLSELAALAEDVGGPAHRFRVVQLPLNLMMTEALTLANQSPVHRPGPAVATEPLTVLEAAAQSGLSVWASAGLFQGRLARRAPQELMEMLPGVRTAAQTALQFVRSVPGLTVALVGSHQAAHVAENMEVARISPLATDQFLSSFFGAA